MKLTIKNREFRESKTELKVYAIHLWKSGESIAQISRDIKKSRETIYRWIHEADHRLASGKSRNRPIVDQQTRLRILETYFVLKKPSIKKLKENIHQLFHIELSEPQLRRLLKKWNVDGYRPSAFFDSLIKIRLGT